MRALALVALLAAAQPLTPPPLAQARPRHALHAVHGKRVRKAQRARWRQ